MRYLFRGYIRDTGKVVEGHVEGNTDDAAIKVLSDNAIICEWLKPDPKPLNLNEELPDAPEFAEALESAFDSSSSQVQFDDLTERYRGKKVWVIDRDKIRRRVAQVVDSALALSLSKAESSQDARKRVASAIHGLFSDNRNIASERNADSIAGMKFTGEENPMATNARPAYPQPLGGRVNAPTPSAAPVASGAGAGVSQALEQQIARLATVVKHAETAMAALVAAARRVGSGGGGGPRRYQREDSPNTKQNEVLLEIFKDNLELQRSVSGIPALTDEGDPAALDTGEALASAETSTDSAPMPQPSAVVTSDDKDEQAPFA